MSDVSTFTGHRAQKYGMRRSKVNGEVNNSQMISPAVDVAPTATTPAAITNPSRFTETRLSCNCLTRTYAGLPRQAGQFGEHRREPGERRLKAGQGARLISRRSASSPVTRCWPSGSEKPTSFHTRRGGDPTARRTNTIRR